MLPAERLFDLQATFLALCLGLTLFVSHPGLLLDLCVIFCCSHVATAVYIACGVAFDPGWHRSTHLPGNLLHRGMPEMAEEALSEWVANDIQRQLSETPFFYFEPVKSYLLYSEQP